MFEPAEDHFQAVPEDLVIVYNDDFYGIAHGGANVKRKEFRPGLNWSEFYTPLQLFHAKTQRGT
jgi:hypothetical protein